MESWNNIINTALLGTDKKELSNTDLDAGIADVIDQVNANNPSDKEERFLQIASVAFNYRQSGVAPLLKDDVTIKPAAHEDKLYCNKKAQHVLKDILEEQSFSLLKLWLQYCNANQQIVLPELIPTLFEIAVNQKKLQPLIISCCGKRGEWLSDFNPDWNFYLAKNDEDVWRNGTFEQRKKLLQKLRETQPTKAKEWLQQTWANENANTKAELLKQLETNISSQDSEWVESLLQEKSQKVKDVTLDLLKQIPGSPVVLSYWNILQQSIILKKEKALLGMMNKISLQIQLSGLDEAIFKTGIEKLSNTKEFSDDEFIIYQLIQFTPPQNWEMQFNSSPEQVIGYFQKDKTHKKYLPAFVNAIQHFRDQKWATSFMNSDAYDISMITILPETDQDKYSIKFFEKEADLIISLARKRETEWSHELARLIFKQAAKNIYQYPKTFYNECIALIPASIISELEKCAPQEEHLQQSWSKMSEYIIKLVTLKLQTIKAFQS